MRKRSIVAALTDRTGIARIAPWLINVGNPRLEEEQITIKQKEKARMKPLLISTTNYGIKDFELVDYNSEDLRIDRFIEEAVKAYLEEGHSADDPEFWLTKEDL